MVIGYWLSDNVNKQRFTVDNLILLVVHHIEPGTSPEEFEEEVFESENYNDIPYETNDIDEVDIKQKSVEV